MTYITYIMLWIAFENIYSTKNSEHGLLWWSSFAYIVSYSECLKSILNGIVPTAFCPPDQSQKADKGNDTKALVEWEMPSCIGTTSENVSSVCSREPGDTFDLGETTVQCNCTKRSKYEDECSFTVIVKGRYIDNTNC